MYVGADASAKRPDVQRFSSGGGEVLGRLPGEEEDGWTVLASTPRATSGSTAVKKKKAATSKASVARRRPCVLKRRSRRRLNAPNPVSRSMLGAKISMSLMNCKTAKNPVRPLAEVPEARAVVTGKLNAAEVLGRFQTAIPALDHQSTSAVAVDQASSEATPLGAVAKGDVYIDNETSIASYHRERGADPALWLWAADARMGVAVNAKTGALYVLDGGEDEVRVFEPMCPASPPGGPVRAEPDPDLGGALCRGQPGGSRHPLLLPVRHCGLREQSLLVHGLAAGAWNRHRRRLRRAGREHDLARP